MMDSSLLDIYLRTVTEGRPTAKGGPDAMAASSGRPDLTPSRLLVLDLSGG
jgi:hypothetical protein